MRAKKVVQQSPAMLEAVDAVVANCFASRTDAKAAGVTISKRRFKLAHGTPEVERKRVGRPNKVDNPQLVALASNSCNECADVCFRKIICLTRLGARHPRDA